VRRGDAWQPIAVREETILRKKHPPVKLNVYSTDVGLLEIESGQAPPEKGLVLAQALSTSRRGAGDTLNRMRRLGEAKDALEVCEIVRGIAISTNWVVADTQGHIAYQQAGYAPVRRGAGIVALPAWDRQNHWQGLVDFQALKHEYDPPRGVVASANETINPPGGPTVVNAAAPRYRVDRIFEALEGQPKISVAQCKALQNDVISRQALRFLPFVVPFLPENECANLLRTWDGAYDPQSRTPTLFEAIYAEVLLLAFGEQFLGRDVWRHLADETALTHIYFGGLDRTLLDEPRWWSAGEREFTFAQAVSTVMARYGSVQEIPLWGEVHRLNMNNLFLAGKIGQWLKASRGPYPLAGGRATLVQTAVFRADGRETSICPSWRMVTDMGRDEVETVLAGGPSERIFSPLYDIDIEDWIAGRYKIIRP
jgi:penicillin amidase